MERKQLNSRQLAPYQCQQVEDLASLYLDSELNPRQVERFETHLRNCSTCRDLVNDCADIVEQAKALVDQPLPSGVSDRLRSRLGEVIENNFTKTRPRLYLLK